MISELNRSVLVVEDDQIDTEYIVKTLGQLGIPHEVAPRSYEAIALLARKDSPRPALVLLDEPLTGLDPLGIRRMKEALRSRAESGAALVLSSHLLPLVEELCHRVLILARGRAVALGTVPEIRAQAGAAGSSLEDLFLAVTREEASG